MASKKKAKPKKLVGFRYLGGGYHYVQGLPARDLTVEEIKNQLQRWGGVESFAKRPGLYEALYASEEEKPDKEVVPEAVPEVVPEAPEPEPVPEVVVAEPESSVEDIVPLDDKE